MEVPHVKSFKCISLTIHEDKCAAPMFTHIYPHAPIVVHTDITKVNKNKQTAAALDDVVVDSLHIGGRGCSSLEYLS